MWFINITQPKKKPGVSRSKPLILTVPDFELRFYDPLDTKQVSSERFFPANLFAWYWSTLSAWTREVRGRAMSLNVTQRQIKDLGRGGFITGSVGQKSLSEFQGRNPRLQNSHWYSVNHGRTKNASHSSILALRKLSMKHIFYTIVLSVRLSYVAFMLVHDQVTIIFVVSVCLSVCLCRVFLSRLWSDFNQTRTYVICLDLVVSPSI